MKNVLASIGAAVVAALCFVVLRFFAKDPAHGVNTGFTATEIKAITGIVFFIVFGVFSSALKKAPKKHTDSSRSE